MLQPQTHHCQKSASKRKKYTVARRSSKNNDLRAPTLALHMAPCKQDWDALRQQTRRGRTALCRYGDAGELLARDECGEGCECDLSGGGFDCGKCCGCCFMRC